ncbi:MAG: phytoene/squalene synthase family protein [Marinobacter adhaerens]
MNTMVISPEHNETTIDVLRTNGRSFYWAGQLLSGAQLSNAARLYSLCRAIDDLADEASTPQQKALALSELNDIESALAHHSWPEGKIGAIPKQAFSLFPNHPVAIAALRDLIKTIKRDLQPVSIEGYPELIQYAYGVAGTVGVMMSCVLDAKNLEKALPHAIDLGIGMQLTNIARDVLEDAYLDRIYLPAQSAAGPLEPNRLITGDPDARNMAWKGIRELLLIAEGYYQSGWEGLGYLPVRPRISIAVAARLYRQIGRQILSEGQAVYWSRRTVVSWPQKISVSLKAMVQLTGQKSSPVHGDGHRTCLHQGIETCLKDFQSAGAKHL